MTRLGKTYMVRCSSFTEWPQLFDLDGNRIAHPEPAERRQVLAENNGRFGIGFHVAERMTLLNAIKQETGTLPRLIKNGEEEVYVFGSVNRALAILGKESGASFRPQEDSKGYTWVRKDKKD